MATILILGVKVPFTSGGQDVLVQTLKKELVKRGHRVDLLELPFSVFPKESFLEQAAIWRSYELEKFGGEKVDLVIATKFPSYYAHHPKKSLWLVHQHRPLYDLYGSRYSDISDDPRDEMLRRMLVDGDRRVIGESSYVSGISKNVVDRLNRYLGIAAEVLYPPLPQGDNYYRAEPQDYILSVGRLCSIKRVDLMIKALPFIHQFVKLKVVGVPDESGVLDYYQNEIAKHHLEDRVEFLGRVEDKELLRLYAESLAVYYAPHDEDYGYVTLEAMAAGKPVIAAKDSGGVLEFVEHEHTGLVLDPNSESIGLGINRLVEDKEFASELGLKGKKFVDSSGLACQGWDSVIAGLLSPLNPRELSRSSESQTSKPNSSSAVGNLHD